MTSSSLKWTPDTWRGGISSTVPHKSGTDHFLNCELNETDMIRRLCSPPVPSMVSVENESQEEGHIAPSGKGGKGSHPWRPYSGPEGREDAYSGLYPQPPVAETPQNPTTVHGTATETHFRPIQPHPTHMNTTEGYSFVRGDVKNALEVAKQLKPQWDGTPITWKRFWQQWEYY